MNLKETTIKKETLFKGRIVDLNIHEVNLPNGKTSKREIVNHPGAVAIIAFSPDNRLVMVKQFRKALEKAIIEIPAGKLEGEEEPLETARRELEEETGYRAEKLRKVASFYTSPGFSDEIVHLYEAHSVTEGMTATDEDEFVEVVHVSLEEAEALIETEEIHDAKTMFAIQYAKQLKQT